MFTLSSSIAADHINHYTLINQSKSVTKMYKDFCNVILIRLITRFTEQLSLLQEPAAAVDLNELYQRVGLMYNSRYISVDI